MSLFSYLASHLRLIGFWAIKKKQPKTRLLLCLSLCWILIWWTTDTLETHRRQSDLPFSRILSKTPTTAMRLRLFPDFQKPYALIAPILFMLSLGKTALVVNLTQWPSSQDGRSG